MKPVICFCGYHKKKLILSQGRSLLYYMCPNYRMENRQGDDVICTNHFSVGVIDEVKDAVMYEDYEPGKERIIQEGNIDVSYRIEDDEDFFSVYLINNKKKRRL